MFRHRFLSTTSWRTRFDWYILSFLAGSINAGGYLAAHRFVSHVTGFATLFGIDAAQGRWDAALGIATVPLYFLLGVMIAAWLIDRRKYRGQRPLYAEVMALVCLCLILAAAGGFLGFFGEFGSEPKLRQDYILLALLCMASGLQNAAISSASSSTVRTTHLTGITTDLGIGIVRGLSNPKFFQTEKRASIIRIGLWNSFAFGSAFGAVVVLRYQYLGFLFPALIAAYCFFEALMPIRRLSRIRKKR